MNYEELKNKQQEEFNNFSNDKIFYAFSDKQFKDGLNKFNCTEKDIYNLDNGGFILKENSKDLHMLMEKFDQELKEKMQDFDFAFEAFLYEMYNYEYCFNQNVSKILKIFNLWDEKNNKISNKNYIESFNKAHKTYMNEAIKKEWI